jgi:hypothetical protein
MHLTEESWAKTDPKAHKYAVRYGMIHRLRELHNWLIHRRPRGYWTKERCIEDAKRYSTKSAWSKANASACGIARNNGWLDECCAHMEQKYHPAGYWTKERCIEDAKQFNTTYDWRHQGVGHGYHIACKNGWLEECCRHMVKPKRGSKR